MRRCASASTLLAMSGGLVEPLEFLIPCYGSVDRWFYGAGLALYDLLSGRHAIGHHRRVDASTYEAELPRDGLALLRLQSELGAAGARDDY